MAFDRSASASTRSLAAASGGVAVEDLPRLSRLPDLTLLDVRPRRDYRRAHLPGSHSIPAGLLLASELPEGELLLVGVDSAQAIALIDALHDQGYSRGIRYLRGGFAAWLAAQPGSVPSPWSLARRWFAPGLDGQHQGWSVARGRA